MNDIVGKYTTEALVRAMAPLDDVIDNFQACHLKRGRVPSYTIKTSEQREMPVAGALLFHNNDDSDKTSCMTNTTESEWGEKAQGAFAGILFKIVQLPNGKPAPFQPTNRYIRKLLQRFASRVEKVTNLENEAFAELMFKYHLRPTKGDHPDPNLSCHVSFSLSFATSSQDKDHPIIGIKIFPHHNDVGVRRVWEAGAALAEYLFENPQLVRQKNICEIGAGVGLTGISIAGLCDTKSVHMTDYTDSTLVNMEHNVLQNEGWFTNTKTEQVDCSDFHPVTTGYLEWEHFSKDKQYVKDEAGGSTVKKSPSIYQSPTTSMALAKNADVLIAADVVYNHSQIPTVVSCVTTFLSGSRNKLAIFATTYRNEKTFNFFEEKLKNEGIKICYVPTSQIENMINMFPCYFDQPRTDVRICTMTK
mmetsp:Transcript_17562/g.33305  ORF Transcript_17562/g.33305 Transcript_17562/m.33305 type:complete len:418 (+) Transcript_17562:48-1301(+)